MLDEIKKLKKQYQNAEKDTDIEVIFNKMNVLFDENQDSFADAMVLCMKESNQKADELLLRQKLDDILPAISISYLSKNYFKKTPQWFYQRLNGNNVNGKEAHFTTSELQTLSIALKEIGQKVSTSAALVF